MIIYQEFICISHLICILLTFVNTSILIRILFNENGKVLNFSNFFNISEIESCNLMSYEISTICCLFTSGYIEMHGNNVMPQTSICLMLYHAFLCVVKFSQNNLHKQLNHEPQTTNHKKINNKH